VLDLRGTVAEFMMRKSKNTFTNTFQPNMVSEILYFKNGSISLQCFQIKGENFLQEHEVYFCSKFKNKYLQLM